MIAILINMATCGAQANSRPRGGGLCHRGLGGRCVMTYSGVEACIEPAFWVSPGPGHLATANVILMYVLYIAAFAEIIAVPVAY